MNMLLCVRRTTIVLDEALYKALRRKAAESSTTLKALISDALRTALREPVKKKEGYRFNFPTARGGLQPGVDLNNWAALRDLMDGIR